MPHYHAFRLTVASQHGRHGTAQGLRPQSLSLRPSATTSGLTLLLTAVICLGHLGCIPLPSETTRGHRYPSDVLAFLSNPGVSREEVLAELGPPLFESEASRTLVYDWEQTPRYLVPV